eukprot:1209968-Amphidinium_carterae.1
MTVDDGLSESADDGIVLDQDVTSDKVINITWRPVEAHDEAGMDLIAAVHKDGEIAEFYMLMEGVPNTGVLAVPAANFTSALDFIDEHRWVSFQLMLVPAE